MANGGDRITWKWLTGILVTVLLVFLGYMGSEVRRTSRIIDGMQVSVPALENTVKELQLSVNILNISIARMGVLSSTLFVRGGARSASAGELEQRIDIINERFDRILDSLEDHNLPGSLRGGEPP